ncbi:MAG: glycosyltransferase family 4 protein [Prolixibacteraceae bacterium]|nr:glycosyltransferase family 4 protein [Prolixibacteraceae bacterium]
MSNRNNLNAKKQIVIVAGVFYPEPVVSASLLFDLANELAVNYNVTVLRPFPTRPHGFKVKDIRHENYPFKIVYLKSFTCSKSSLLGRLYESYSMGKHSVRFLKKNYNQVDFIYNAPWQLFGRYLVAKFSKKNKIPYITPVQDIYPESITSKLPKWPFLHSLVTKILIPIDKYTLQNATKIHTISDKMKSYLVKTRNLPEDRFIVIQNWQNEEEFIDFSKLNNIKPHTSDKFTFMYMGNVGPLAGLEMVIDAFKKIDSKKCRLVIAGSGSARQRLQKKVVNEQINNIEFWDVPNGKVPEIQSDADVMLLPVKKGFSKTSIPSKLPAYMFSAKPVLASVDNDSDIAFAIKSAKCGWISESENVNMLATRIKNILNLNTEQLTEMGQKGFNYSMTYFSRKNNMPKLVEACHNIINN